MWYNITIDHNAKRATDIARKVVHTTRMIVMSNTIIPPRKKCTKCGIEKPRIEFNSNVREKDGLQKHCKSCLAEYRRENKDKIALSNKRSYEANRERHNEQSKKDYIRNRELRKAQGRARRLRVGREAINEYRREYYQKNPEKYLQAKHRRRARLKGNFTDVEWKTCLDYFNNTCAYCGAQQSFWFALEMEHFIAISSEQSLGHVKENIIPACKSCNSSKQDTPVLDWLVSRFGKQKANRIMKRIQTYFNFIKGGA